MDYPSIVEVIAPCGLDCGKCLAFQGGAIRRHSQALVELLGPNFDQYAQRFTGMNPVFEAYPDFKELLAFLARGSCRTCRQGECLFQACRVRGCAPEKGVDFCFQCPEFPCAETGFPAPLEARWRRNNELMRELGVEGYFERIKDQPRYP